MPRGRIFNIMQYALHPNTGEELITEEVIESALEHKSIKQWAWAKHDNDVYTELDESDSRIPATKHAGDLKPLHFHIVLRSDSALDVSMIARWFKIPENFIDIPKGRGAFLDCVEYLTHESAKEQENGKFLYSDEKIHANWDFRADLNEKAERRAKYGRDLSPKEQQRYEVMVEGKTLRQCRAENPFLYMNDFQLLKKLRLEFLEQKELPKVRQNYYICGGGGVGKGLASRALARSLFPDVQEDEDLIFEVGAEEVGFDGYDGQPVIIWNDHRAEELIKKLHGRGNVFNVFDPLPTKSKQHIKYGSINLVNSVNIVNSVQPYNEFLEGLVKQGDGDSEDKNQSYRRFPFIIPLREQDFDFLINEGYYTDSGNYDEWVIYKNILGNFPRIRSVLGNGKEARMIENNLLALPVSESKKVKEKLLQAVEAEEIDIECFSEFLEYGELTEPAQKRLGI